MTFGVWSLVPPAVVVTVALKTRRAFEPLLVGCLAGYLMIDWRAFPGNFLEGLLKTFQDESLVWVIVVCALYGSIIQLMVNSGGIRAFGDWLARSRCPLLNDAAQLVTTWQVGGSCPGAKLLCRAATIAACGDTCVTRAQNATIIAAVEAICQNPC